jgi:hypothetical protein
MTERRYPEPPPYRPNMALIGYAEGGPMKVSLVRFLAILLTIGAIVLAALLLAGASIATRQLVGWSEIALGAALLLTLAA